MTSGKARAAGALPGSQGPGHGIGTGRPAEPPLLLHPARPPAVPDEKLHVDVHILTDLAPTLLRVPGVPYKSAMAFVLCLD